MRLGITIVTTALSASALAMNVADVPVKCTAPDGTVTKNKGSCPPGNKIEIDRHDGIPSSTAQGVWQFTKHTDSMTNATTCMAMSPSFTIPAKRTYPAARLVVAISSTDAAAVLVRMESKNEIFHHNVAGTGLKVGDAPMLPFGTRPMQTMLAMPQGTGGPVIDAMHRAKTARVRVRIWPWDETYDSFEITLTGYQQAISQAKNCARSL